MRRGRGEESERKGVGACLAQNRQQGVEAALCRSGECAVEEVVLDVVDKRHGAG